MTQRRTGGIQELNPRVDDNGQSSTHGRFRSIYVIADTLDAVAL
jgi:hypothetical protein